MKKARGSISNDVSFQFQYTPLSLSLLLISVITATTRSFRQFLASYCFAKPKEWIGQGGAPFEGRFTEFLEPLTPTIFN